MRRFLVAGGDRGRRLAALAYSWLSFGEAHINRDVLVGAEWI